MVGPGVRLFCQSFYSSVYALNDTVVSSRTVILKVQSICLWESLKAFQWSQGQNFFHSNIKILFALLTVLMFELIVKKQWLVKQLAPQHRLRHWYQTVNSKCIPHCHALTAKKKSQFHIRMSFMKW